MHYLPLHFDSEGTEYVLWLWKGDYWGLQGGAEIGLYCDFENNEYNNDILHYHVADMVLPMTLSLYGYKDGTSIENKFSWAPEENQWWITGFNPRYLGDEVNVEKQVMIGSVDFSKYTSSDEENKIYKAFKDQLTNDNSKYIVFDKNNYTIWVLWYEL